MQSSTSDIQLVIDVANQANVYVTESGYRDRVLGALVSAVTFDSNGWWLEVKLLKSALSPEVPLEGVIGLDFNFRDNDADNDPESIDGLYLERLRTLGEFSQQDPGPMGARPPSRARGRRTAQRRATTQCRPQALSTSASSRVLPGKEASARARTGFTSASTTRRRSCRRRFRRRSIRAVSSRIRRITGASTR